MWRFHIVRLTLICHGRQGLWGECYMARKGVGKWGGTLSCGIPTMQEMRWAWRTCHHWEPTHVPESGKLRSRNFLGGENGIFCSPGVQVPWESGRALKIHRLSKAWYSLCRIDHDREIWPKQKQSGLHPKNCYKLPWSPWGSGSRPPLPTDTKIWDIWVSHIIWHNICT